MIKLSPYDLEILTPAALGQILHDILGIKTLTQADLAYAALVIEIGADINLKDNRGHSPLHHAAIYGKIEIVKILLQAGAKLDIQDNDGRSPLHRAARNGKIGILKILIDAGAKLDIQDNEGETPWDYASYDIKAACLKLNPNK